MHPVRRERYFSLASGTAEGRKSVGINLTRQRMEGVEALMEVDKSMRILVVDDSKAMRNLIKTVLRKAGFHNLSEAEDGEEAWSTLANQAFDLLMSDWNMPHMDGISLLRKVRESEELKELPFLMVTAEGFKENVIEAVEAGVNGYIVKPFSPQAIEVKISKIFARIPTAA